jgi:hypothetical protein
MQHDLDGIGSGTMSLVHEALLKAEREKQRKTGSASVFAQWTQPVATRPTPKREERQVAPTKAAPIPQTPVSVVAAPAQKSHQTVLVLVGACVALVAIVAIVFMVNRTVPTMRKPESSVSSSSVPIVSPPAATPSPADASRYKISGIMKDPQGNYCAVINGHVVYVEQYIDGAIVKKIERDRATLDENGREFVVRLF